MKIYKLGLVDCKWIASGTNSLEKDFVWLQIVLVSIGFDSTIREDQKVILVNLAGLQTSM